MSKEKKAKKYGKFFTQELENPCKTLLANIRFAGVDEPFKTIAVTSSAANEGKTTVCTNLAHAMASSGKRTLLVEGDMRRRSLARILNIFPQNGLFALLAGSCTLEEAITPTEVPNLYFLDAEPSIPNPADVCSTKRFELLVGRLRELFDYVVFDTPPVGTFIDAAVIGSHADATVLCLRQRSTGRDIAVSTVQQLRAGNCNLIGTVMTFAEDHEDEYYAYYTQDGKRVNKADMVGDLLIKGDLADTNLDDWARKMGIGQTGVRGSALGSRAADAKATVPAASPVPSSAPAPAAQPAASATAPVNPFSPGAFKARPSGPADSAGGPAPLGKHSRPR